MPFYTFILDYKGGTYVSQVESSSNKTACFNWAKGLNISEIYGFGKSGKEKLIEQMKTETPTLLNGLINVWFVSALISGELASINFVQTENSTDNEQLSTDN